MVQANHGEAERGSRAGGEEDGRDTISGEKAKQSRLGSSTGLDSPAGGATGHGFGRHGRQGVGRMVVVVVGCSGNNEL